MKLSSQQSDFLNEICNIGISRAASQLSLLLNDEIIVSVPSVEISSVSELSGILGLDFYEVFSIVSQTMSGCFSGRSALMFNSKDSTTLVQYVLKDLPSIDKNDYGAYKQESMIEIGNIIVSASVSSLADLLKSEVVLTVPEYKEESLLTFFQADSKKPVVAITATLQSSSENLSGVLLFVFEKKSIDKLLDILSGKEIKERSDG